MKHKYTISEEQLEKLQSGEDVTLKNSLRDEVVVHPPCSSHGHEWSYSTVRRDHGECILRRCTKCDERQESNVSITKLCESSNLFD